MALRPFGMRWFIDHLVYCDLVRHRRGDERRGCWLSRNSFVVRIERDERFGEFFHPTCCLSLLRSGRVRTGSYA